ncbi:MAG: DUF2332 domain-containing protein [Alphaproteobacteria bacterium]
METSERIAQRLRHFGEVEATTSPLYRRLAPLCAEREALLRVLQERRSGQPPANVLLAAVQRRLMERPEAALAAYFPTLGGSRPPDAALAAAFDTFWPAEREAIAELVRTRRVATNEVRRCAILRPAFVVVARRLIEGGRPPSAHLVEIGASAGLLLAWDRLAYRYGPHRFGPQQAPLELASEWRAPRPPDPLAPFTVAERIGIDVEPVNLADPQEVAWLRALIWPEHVERAAAFDAATVVARELGVAVLAADALSFVPGGLEALPGRLPAVVVHAFTVNRFSDAMRAQFDQGLGEAARTRPIFRVGLEWAPGGARLELTTYPGGRPTLVARADPQGAWIEPLDDALAPPPG